MSELKILVCGDVCGNFSSMFSKVGMIVKKKGTFEHLFCVGNFFGSNLDEWEDLKSGKITVPITTYILGPNELAHEKLYSSLDSIPNIIYLGKKGCLTGSSGLKIAYLSGVEYHDSGGFRIKSNNNSSSKNDSMYFTKKDVNDLLSSLESETVIDILLTSQWPKDITKYAVSVDKEASSIDNCSSLLISKLAKALKPRYHFCGLAGVHYERVPYRNHAVLQESSVHVTRFFALAPVNNSLKHKWLYAFNITPASKLTFKQLTETHGPATVCPYEFDESSEKNECQFFYDTESSTPSKRRSKGSGDHPSKKQNTIDSSSCWFCLSNSGVEKQLIISIGNHCYVTLAKGILVPEHTLIVPINHALSSVQLSNEVSEELEKFKLALASYFHEKGKDVVFFERNYSSPHLQVQAVPVPKQHHRRIQEALFATAKQYNLEFNELPSFSNLQQVVPSKKPYFYIEIMINKKVESKYLHIINQKFPLQFGRIVLANPEILDVEDRIDWRQCEDSKSVEREMTEKMRKGFAPYDFS